MKQIKLINNFQAFNIDNKIKVRHPSFSIIWNLFHILILFQYIATCEDEIRDELLNYKSQIHQQYQQLYDKSYEGILGCTLDEGGRIFSVENLEINENYNQKLSFKYKNIKLLWNSILQIFFFIKKMEITDFSIDQLLQHFLVSSKLLLNYEFYYFYYIQQFKKSLLPYTVYCSESTGLRIDLNIEIPLLENQFVIFHSTSSKSGASQEIQPQKKLLANLKNNSLGVYSQKFDFLELNNSQDLQCYQQNVMILQDVQSCTQNCTLQSNYNQILGASSVSQNITDSSYFIVDNTQLPCVNGTFFKLLVPWVTVQVLFTFYDSSYLIGTIIIVLLVTIITIQIMSIIVLYYKLRKYKKKMKRSQDKNIAKRNNVMRSDYQENNEEQSISLQEIKSQQISYFQN